MIVSVGTDLVDLERLRSGRAQRRAHLDRLLTRASAPTAAQPRPAAVDRCSLRGKEAIMKCLGTGWGHGVGWRTSR